MDKNLDSISPPCNGYGSYKDVLLDVAGFRNQAIDCLWILCFTKIIPFLKNKYRYLSPSSLEKIADVVTDVLLKFIAFVQRPGTFTHVGLLWFRANQRTIDLVRQDKIDLPINDNTEYDEFASTPDFDEEPKYEASEVIKEFYEHLTDEQERTFFDNYYLKGVTGEKLRILLDMGNLEYKSIYKRMRNRIDKKAIEFAQKLRKGNIRF